MTNKHEESNAAARLSKLPVVRSACRSLSHLSHIYADTKHNHPNLRSVCEVLEKSVTALSTVAFDSVSPVIVKLQPQISAANSAVCKSLDWLENTLSVLHTPAEIAATARSKAHEIQDVVSLVANGTMECVTLVMERMQHEGDDGTNSTLAERAITVASVGLDAALNTAEALMDQVLPLNEEEKKAAAAHPVQGFDGFTLRRGYAVRLASLTVELCWRTYHMVGAEGHYVQVLQTFPRPSALVEHLQITWSSSEWNLEGVPQYLQLQAVSVLFFFSQMFKLIHPSEQNQSYQVRRFSADTVWSSQKGETQVNPKVSPHTCRTRSSRISPMKGCARHLK